MIWKINPSTRTEDKKEKQTSSGGWRVKEEVSPHRGVRALLRGAVSRSGEAEGLRQTWRGCSTQGAGATGRFTRGSGQARRPGEQIRIRMRGVRAETEQEEPRGTPIRGGGEGRIDIV